MRLRNIGCGADSKPVTIPYVQGPHLYRDEHIVGKVWLEGYQSIGQLDILRVRMSYRDAPEKKED
jgi:hypothetical protein